MIRGLKNARKAEKQTREQTNRENVARRFRCQQPGAQLRQRLPTAGRSGAGTVPRLH